MYTCSAWLKRVSLAVLLLVVLSAPGLALEKVHVVQRGETLASIARRYDVSISQLAALNGIDNSNYIFVGQRVVVPTETPSPPVAPLGVYTVDVDDSLSGIAARYGTSVEKLMAFNGLATPTAIWVGQPILVPVFVDSTPSPDDAAQHVVRVGETLSSIAGLYDVSWQTLATHNSLGDTRALAVGQSLSIPQLEMRPPQGRAGRMVTASSRSHTVVLGESPSSIARLYDVSLQDLMDVNVLTGDDLIWAGQSLRLPLRADGSEPVSTLPVLPAVAAQQVPAHPASNLVHVVQRGESLADIASRYNVAVPAVSEYNSLPSRDLIQPGQRLRIPGPRTGDAGYQGQRWVEIDLSDQTLTAWDGDDIYLHTSISSGLAQYPTPVGHFNVWHMNPKQTMSGPGYSLPNVKFNMYFVGEVAMHGTWWHDNFGQPMSRGCVNMRESEAQHLYDFVSLGMEVWVHH